MAVETDHHACLLAFNPFGLGAAPGTLSLAASDPRRFLLEELHSSRVALIDDTSLISSHEALQQS